MRDDWTLVVPRLLRTLRGAPELPSMARDHHPRPETERDHLPALRAAGRAFRHHRRSPYLCVVFILLALTVNAEGQTLGDRVTQANQQFPQALTLVNDLWAAVQAAQGQVTALSGQLAQAQAQASTDATTIASLKAQIASLQAQIAGFVCPVCPACTPVVCPAPIICPVPVVCPSPIPPPVITPPPPLPTGSASLAWDAVGGATGYKVYFGTASGAYTQNIPTTLTTMTVGGLSNARWFFVVTAIYPAGESGFSNEVFKDIGTVLPPPPSAVIQLTVPLVGSITDSAGAVWSLAPKDPAIEGGLQYVVKRNGANNGTAIALCYSGGVIYAKNLPTVWVWYSWSDTGWARVTAPAGCV